MKIETLEFQFRLKEIEEFVNTYFSVALFPPFQNKREWEWEWERENEREIVYGKSLNRLVVS